MMTTKSVDIWDIRLMDKPSEVTADDVADFREICLFFGDKMLTDPRYKKSVPGASLLIGNILRDMYHYLHQMGHITDSYEKNITYREEAHRLLTDYIISLNKHIINALKRPRKGLGDGE